MRRRGGREEVAAALPAVAAARYTAAFQASMLKARRRVHCVTYNCASFPFLCVSRNLAFPEAFFCLAGVAALRNEKDRREKGGGGEAD